MCFIGKMSCKPMKKMPRLGYIDLVDLAIFHPKDFPVQHALHIALCSGLTSELYHEADCYRTVQGRIFLIANFIVLSCLDNIITQGLHALDLANDAKARIFAAT